MLTDLQEINPSNTRQLSSAPGLVHRLFKNLGVRYYISGTRQRVVFIFFFFVSEDSVWHQEAAESL